MSSCRYRTGCLTSAESTNRQSPTWAALLAKEVIAYGFNYEYLDYLAARATVLGLILALIVAYKRQDGAEEVTEPGRSAVRQFDKPHRTQFLRFNLREVDRPRDCRGFTSHAMAAQAYADGGLAGFSTLRASVQRIRSLVAGYPTFRSFVHAFGDFCGRFSDFANQIRARRFGN